jgi:hypothetical protein
LLQNETLAPLATPPDPVPGSIAIRVERNERFSVNENERFFDNGQLVPRAPERGETRAPQRGENSLAARAFAEEAGQ